MTFLGTGTSVGVPVIGCDCEVCRSPSPFNRRTRSALHLSCGDTSVLIDSGPDLREQALRENLRVLDAVLYTHAHLDHIAGFDELRAFCWHRKSPLPLYATASCLETLKRMFGWAFSPGMVHQGYVRPDPKLITGPFAIGALKFHPLPVEHAEGVETIGFMIIAPRGQRVAYLPDVKSIPQATMDALAKVDMLVIDALGHRSHPTHLSLAEAIEIASIAQAKRALFTHIGHDIDHPTTAQTLPPAYALAWDGLRVVLA